MDGVLSFMFFEQIKKKKELIILTF